MGQPLKIRPAAALAAAAVIVAMPRYLIAQRFADGQPAPAGAEWQTLVDLSAVAWAILEALTLAYIQTVYGQTKTPTLRRWSLIVTGCIAIVSAPTIVAVSAGLSLTALLGIATPLHVLWSTFLTASYALIVLAAFAADSASAERARRVDELIDSLDAAGERPQAIAAAQVTVNVGQNAAPEPQGSDSSPVAAAARLPAPKKPSAATEQAVAAAIAAGKATSPAIAAEIGKSPALVKRTDAWHKFRQGVTR